MSCCGRARAPAEPQPVRREATFAAPQPLQAAVSFEYTGATRLVADGPVTRQRYRFEQPGARVAVDARDAASFAAVPNLRRIRA